MKSTAVVSDTSFGIVINDIIQPVTGGLCTREQPVISRARGWGRHVGVDCRPTWVRTEGHEESCSVEDRAVQPAVYWLTM